MTEDARTWYKDAIIYQLHVRAFCDQNGDGIGDFRGLAQKLDYIHDLGVTAIWLLPFYPSPLKDDGYDIADYTNVHSSYGTLRDFKTFLREAHRRGLRVITELVVNHTSDEHVWFQKARRGGPGNRWREFYVWGDDAKRYSEARIIFQDFEISNWEWDPIASAYYWHRFYKHQPDLNYNNPDVRREVLKALDFWMDMGVDGYRLDAVPYLFEREGTTCENLPETHDFLRQLRAHIDEKFENRMLLAEANQWPEDAAAYFGDGDECHMNFHFPLMPRLFMALEREDRFPVIDILGQTPELPPNCQWAIFLRNHDELTLEMVTDEERDYMYRVYADDPQARINLGIRRRLAPLLGNDRRKIELMNGLLFSLPGTPILYYGDEIGMGDNIYLGDRDGVRTPMQWSADRNAGFSRANPQRLNLPVIVDPEFHFTAINVEAQENNPHSLLWWMRRLIALRKRYRVFGRGSIEFLFPENGKVLAFLREYEDESVLVVANLSRFAQYLELDLSRYQGMMPVELFGQTPFPPIGELPYLLTLGPHSFYWFLLEQQVCEIASVSGTSLPHVRVKRKWEDVFRGRARGELASAVGDFLKRHRRFSEKGLSIQSVKLEDSIGVNGAEKGERFYLVLAQVSYANHEPETYVLPLAWTTGAHMEQLLHDSPGDVVLRITLSDRNTEGLLYEASHEHAVCSGWLAAVAKRRRFKGDSMELLARQTPEFRRLSKPATPPAESSADATTGRAARADRGEGHGRGLATSAADSGRAGAGVHCDGVRIPTVGARGLRPDEDAGRLERTDSVPIIFGEALMLRLFRRLDRGISPELEIGRFLNKKLSLCPVPKLAGALEIRPQRGEPLTLGVLHEYVPNEGTAWSCTLDELGRYYERVTAHSVEREPVLDKSSTRPLIDLAKEGLSEVAGEMIGPYVQLAELMGHRTAELHIALTSEREDSDFRPEPISTFYQRSLYQSMRSLTKRVFGGLRKRLKELPAAVQESAERVLSCEPQILAAYQRLRERKVAGMRIRCHGNYHLGQLLYTGKDFVIVDFRGEPSRPVSERRIKRSPLRDVASMIRSFYRASEAARLGQVPEIGAQPQVSEDLSRWGDFWASWSAACFLKGYQRAVEGVDFAPRTEEELRVMLDAFLLEKTISELQDELSHDPAEVRIPLAGIEQLLARSA